MILNNLNKRIIKELFLNSRVSNSELGKKLGTSKEVINYRINRLLKQGIIKKFIPLIDYSVLGYTIYRIQLKFKSKNKGDWYSFLNSVKETSWIVELSGYWDVVVLFWVKSNNDFFQIIDKINDHFAGEIMDVLFTIVNTIYHFPPNFIIEKQSLKEETLFYRIGPHSGEPVEIEELQIKLLKELLKEGRAPLLQIARNLNSSATNINYHLKKLLEKGVILGFVPVIDHTKIGLTHFKITLQLQDPSQKNILKSLLMKSNSIIYITESYGKYDLEFEYVTEKIENLFAYIEEISSPVPLKNYEIIFNNKEVQINETPFG